MAGFDKNNIPKGVEVSPEGIISCTREALNRLGDWCRQNAGALAISVFATAGVHNALAQTAPASPSTSASATADKGGGQVVNIDGITYTFAKIAGMDPSERKKLQSKLDGIDPETGEDLKVFLKQAANQRIEDKKGVEQAANQRIEDKKGVEQGLDTRLINKYEQYIANIERGARGDRKTVETIANAEISPQELRKRANALLNRTDIILAGI